MSSDLRLAPHRDHVALQTVLGKGSFLLHALTFERVKLPGEEDADWRLGLDAQGYAFVADGARRLQAADLFQMKLFVCEGSEVERIVALPDGSRIPLAKAIQEGRVCEFKLTFGQPAADHDLVCMRLRRGSHGCQVWWSLPSVLSALKLKAGGGKVSKFLYHTWGAWGRFLAAMGLGANHLRSASSAPQNGAEGVADFPAVSSMALVGLLIRWVGAQRAEGGLSSDEDRQVCVAFLAALLRDAIEPEYTLELFHDKTAAWVPPGFPEGDDEFYLTVKNGVVSMLELRADKPHLVEALFPTGTVDTMGGDDGSGCSISLLALLAAVAKGGEEVLLALSAVHLGFGGEVG